MKFFHFSHVWFMVLVLGCLEFSSYYYFEMNERSVGLLLVMCIDLLNSYIFSSDFPRAVIGDEVEIVSVWLSLEDLSSVIHAC